MADTIREFLVTLGFRVNDAQYRRFIKPIADATDAMSTLSKVTFATAAAIFYTVDKIADQYERLYYASKRTEQSTQALQSYAFAARQIGISAEEAQGAIEAMAAAMRTNPGLRALAGGAQTPAEFVARLKNMGMQYLAAVKLSQRLGIPETQVFQFWNFGERNEADRRKFERRQKEMGVGTDKNVESFVDFKRAVNSLSASLGMLAERVAINWLPTVHKGVNLLDDFMPKLAEIDKETHGWALTIGSLLVPSLAAAIFQVKVFRAGLLLLRAANPFLLAAGAFALMFPSLKHGENKYPVDPNSFGGAVAGTATGWMAKVLQFFGMTPEFAQSIVGKSPTAPAPAGPGGAAVPAAPGTGGSMFEGLPGWKPGERPLGFEGVPGRQSSLTQHTTITVTGGGDAAATAQRVAELQQRVNADLVRNLQGALA